MSGRFRIVWPHSLLRSSVASAVNDAMAHGHLGVVTRAVEVIEDQLRRSPQTAGESRELDQRVIVEPPVAVQFEIHEEEQVVLITRFRYSPRDPSSETGETNGGGSPK